MDEVHKSTMSVHESRLKQIGAGGLL